MKQNLLDLQCILPASYGWLLYQSTLGLEIHLRQVLLNPTKLRCFLHFVKRYQMEGVKSALPNNFLTYRLLSGSNHNSLHFHITNSLQYFGLFILTKDVHHSIPSNESISTTLGMMQRNFNFILAWKECEAADYEFRAKENHYQPIK